MNIKIKFLFFLEALDICTIG